MNNELESIRQKPAEALFKARSLHLLGRAKEGREKLTQDSRAPIRDFWTQDISNTKQEC
jgi:hypothetical protein